ncbi:hypothetical protein K470DRAFT_261497 [Piedraia hortae CBS 480.64]|uniref:Uncharacterized protein n=1 Tax=Piedraia hortae CBS 480.64 TaxID=1314780 RepID=A0A6A7CA83_9PEZI|nr:hypothetical protein K470DRAFT_261497 [Piedraia hortae CBS 480.64]
MLVILFCFLFFAALCFLDCFWVTLDRGRLELCFFDFLRKDYLPSLLSKKACHTHTYMTNSPLPTRRYHYGRHLESGHQGHPQTLLALTRIYQALRTLIDNYVSLRVPTNPY